MVGTREVCDCVLGVRSEYLGRYGGVGLMRQTWSCGGSGSWREWTRLGSDQSELLGWRDPNDFSDLEDVTHVINVILEDHDHKRAHHWLIMT